MCDGGGRGAMRSNSENLSGAEQPKKALLKRTMRSKFAPILRPANTHISKKQKSRSVSVSSSTKSMKERKKTNHTLSLFLLYLHPTRT